MSGLIIEYDFNGEESLWDSAVQEFLGHIERDEILRENFSYQVFKKAESSGRVHIPKWKNEETLKHLQSQDFFKEFAGKIKGFAGDSLKTTKITEAHSS